MSAPAPVVTAVQNTGYPVEEPIPTTIAAFAPTVVGAIGAVVESDTLAATIAMPEPTVRAVRVSTNFADTQLASASMLEPTVTAEFNARVEAPTATASSRMPKPDSINGSREVEIDAVARAGASMIPGIQIIATLSIQVDNPASAQAYPFPADARTGVRVPNDASGKASGSALEPTVRTDVRIPMTVAPNTARALNTTATRTHSRIAIGVTALAAAQMPEPFAQAFIKREDAIITSERAYSLFRAVAPEFLTTPAEVGDGLVLYLGATVGEVRLGARRTDINLGSTHGSVELTDVRDEEKV